MHKPGTIQLSKSFFRLGATAYGGPAMVVNIGKLVVGKYRWLEENEFHDGIALCQVIPGATAVQMSAYVGYKLRGVIGALVAAISFVLPAFLLMILLSSLYLSNSTISLIHSLFTGLRAMVVSIITYSAFNLGKSTIKDWQAVIIALVALAAYWARINVIVVILLSGLLGFAFYWLKARGKSINNRQNYQAEPKTFIPLWYFISTIIIVFIGLLISFKFAPVIARLSLSLIKIGSVAFGGGYTMIPLIQSEVVDKYHWLSTQEFMDGIAMGQITPGPIIITSTFVGYKIYGFVGAVISTAAVLLPSFFILVYSAQRYEKLKNYEVVRWIVSGILSSFISMLIITAINFGRTSLLDIKTAIMAVATLICMFIKVDMLYIIVIGAILSIILFH